MDTKKGEKRISPSEYLRFALAFSQAAQDSFLMDYRNYRLIVTGGVDLSNYPQKNLVKVLPEAEIQGPLQAEDCPALEIADCHVQGDAFFDSSGLRETGPNFYAGGLFEARSCRKLRSLRGVFPSSVFLEDSGIETLCSDFFCRGDLNVARCPSLRLLNCNVGGYLHAEGSSLQELGPDFRCTKNLHLNRCQNLKKIGKVQGPPCDVMLGHSGIEEIGGGFSCTGALLLQEVSSLRSLAGVSHYRLEVEYAPLLHSVSFLSLDKMDFSYCPSLKNVDFRAGSDVVFHECGVREFSVRSTAEGNLTVRQCQHFESLSGTWGGGVNMIGLRAFAQIAAGFRCHGDLLVRQCDDFVALEGEVSGSTTLSGVCNLRVIPRSFSTGGKLVLACSDLRLKSLGCRVGGELVMTNCHAPFSTLPSFQVGGDALFQDCRGMDNLRGRIEGSVVLRSKTGVSKIGADFECGGDLIVTDCPRLEVLNCRVGGDVIVTSSPLQKTGPAFSCEGKLEILDQTNLRELRGRARELKISSSNQRLDDVKVNLHTTLTQGGGEETEMNRRARPLPSGLRGGFSGGKTAEELQGRGRGCFG